MPRAGPRSRRSGLGAAAAAVVLVVLLSAPGSIAGNAAARAGLGAGSPAETPLAEALAAAPLAPVSEVPSDLELPGSTALAAPPTAPLALVVHLPWSNLSDLSTLLAGLAQPGGPEYHHFLTAAQFDARFGPSPATYRAVVEYFASAGVGGLTTYPDRATISFSATPAEIASLFHVGLRSFSWEGRAYVAPVGTPELPAPIADAVAQVEGLGTGSSVRAELQSAGTFDTAAPSAGGGPFVAGGELQTAYDELSVFDGYGFPTNATVATISWAGNYTGAPLNTGTCGALTTGEDVGPFSYTDVDDYYNWTIPGEPHASITPVALGNATLPKSACLASWDSTGAVLANTAELEMIGSTAPGARIYSVYTPPAPSATSAPPAAELDQALETILSPPSTLPTAVIDGLGNVSVVSTGWGLSDRNDSLWYALSMEAQARGITLLAGSGNSADNPSSPSWVGSSVEFPASMAYDDFGTTAVGGTTITLGPGAAPHIRTLSAWNNSATGTNSTTHLSLPAGSAGGVSSTILEPRWQRLTSANAVISGGGRGAPDLAAIANNTLITVTLDGAQYDAGNATAGGRFVWAWGTGVATSVVAGMVATVDHALRATGEAPLGFLDPIVYPLADLEYSALPSGTVNGSNVTGSYASPLPTLPFLDVTVGRNTADAALRGYDLVTGWGSLDLDNFTMYVLNASSAGTFGHLSGVEAAFTLTALSATTVVGKGGSGRYNASIQSSFFLANSLGAPVYWVDSIVYLATTPKGWSMNFTGWVVQPFFGLYPNLSVYRYHFPATGLVGGLPQLYLLEAALLPSSSWSGTNIELSFGIPGVAPINLSVPGAAYLVGSADYTYNWQGINHTNGPLGGASPPGFLAPQFGLLGGPSGLGGGVGTFGTNTSGAVSVAVKPLGASGFEAADSSVIASGALQSPESAAHLAYTAKGHANWTVAYTSASGGAQGIVYYEPEVYPVVFDESGVPASARWYVNVTGQPSASGPGTQPTLSLSLSNGTYPWASGISLASWASTPASGSVLVNGAGETVPLAFHSLIGSVTFLAVGPAFPFTWYLNITHGPDLSGSGDTLRANLTFGTYDYHIASSNSLWAPVRYTGAFTVSSKPLALELRISLVTYPVYIVARLPVGDFPHWSVTVDGDTKQGFAELNYEWLLPNGTYTYSIGGLPAGYTASPSSGTIVVHGKVAPITIVVSPPPPLWGLFGLGIWGYVLVGAGGAGAVLGVAYVRRRRRRRRAVESLQAHEEKIRERQRRVERPRNPRGRIGPRPPRRPPPGSGDHPPPRSRGPPPRRPPRWVDPDEL
jgi:hypothetical protein